MSAVMTFCKTPAGQDEMSKRARNLGVAGRRLLILVNGTRSREELSHLVGAKVDLDLELQHLQTEGLIVPLNGARTAPLVAANQQTVEPEKKGFFSKLLGLGPSKPKLEPTQHERMREACFLLHEMLGPEADDFSMQLEDCASQEQLERLLARAASIVQQARGANEAEIFRRATGVA